MMPETLTCPRCGSECVHSIAAQERQRGQVRLVIFNHCCNCYAKWERKEGICPKP